MKNGIVTFVMILFLIACGAGPQCNIEGYRETVQPLLERWDDAVQVAGQTPRIALAAQVSELQDIKRETENMQVDECLQSAHALLVKHMDYSIDGFLAFMADDERLSEQKFDLATETFDDYLERLSQIEP